MKPDAFTLVLPGGCDATEIGIDPADLSVQSN